MSLRDLVVIGGGPAGSVTAAVAARAGLDVLLLEGDRHPRVHVGESLLPGIIPILDAIGALEDIENAGFVPRTGTTHVGWGRVPIWDLWFSDTDLYDHGWFVDRARFDAVLFAAAGRAGAETREGVRVDETIFDGDRLVGIGYGESGARKEVRARWFVDASGQGAVLAGQLGLRRRIDGLRHRCDWARFEGVDGQAPPRQHQAFVVAEHGHFIWCHPLGEGAASVGIVRADDESPTADEAAFDRDVAASEAAMDVLGEQAKRVGAVRTERDWSHETTRVCGPGWLLVGDAAGFTDPVLSSGVFLAMQSAYRAAHAVIDCVRGDTSERKALERYERNHGEVFGDLLRMIRFYYQQNVGREHAFWASKRVLVRDDTKIKPQKAFLVLTSGLVGDLAVGPAALAEREAGDSGTGTLTVAAGPSAPSDLGFVCAHLRHQGDDEAGALFFLVEPRDANAATWFRTRHYNVNCVAPRHEDDPSRYPEMQPHLRQLARRLYELDDREESLAEFWMRARDEIMAAISALPPRFELVRVFGE